MSGRAGEGVLVIRSTLTTTPLGASATFTGPATKVPKGIRRVEINAFADQAGTIFIDSGLTSTGPWRANGSGTAVTANTLTGASIQIVYPFFRVRYVNGASGQGTFELAQMLGTIAGFG